MADYTQPPETIYTGASPQRGVFYVLTQRGEPSHYAVGTGHRLKNGKHVVLVHDLDAGPRRKVVRVSMDAAWLAQWQRAQTVPERAHKLLNEALESTTP